MQKPNINNAGFLNYLNNSDTALVKSINALVSAKRISQVEADKYIAGHLLKIGILKTNFAAATPASYPVLCLAIRGYYLNSQGVPGANDRGIFDDAFVLVGPGYFKTFNANTDPRKAGFGIGSLMPGVHELMQGYHGYGKASGHDAFRTANAKQILPVIRDGQTGIKDGITVNLHRGGVYNTNSIACQTVQADQWPEFKNDAYKLTDKTKRILTYLLVEQISY